MTSTLKMVVSVLLVVGVAGVVNAYSIADDFDSYADGPLLDSSDWAANDSRTPNVQDGIGVGGTKGVTNAQYGAVMSGVEANKVVWGDLAVNDYLVLKMDFESSTTGEFDDDRLYLTYSADNVTSSSNNFGVQLDYTTVDNVNIANIQTYYRSGTDRVEVPFVTDIIAANSTWYTFELKITKTGAESAVFDVKLAPVGGDVIASGTWNTLTSDTRQPNADYFTELWPAFKNYNAASGDADNFSFAVVPEPMTLSLLGLGGLALLRKRRA